MNQDEAWDIISLCMCARKYFTLEMHSLVRVKQEAGARGANLLRNATVSKIYVTFLN